MYIARNIESLLMTVIDHFPAVAVLGPRQVGKTTLVKVIREKLNRECIYLDIENPVDNGALNNPLEFFNATKQKILIIDEIQRNPALFPVLRSAIDQKRINGRFILLGSASKEFLFLSNETLAGRVVYIELTPFSYTEINKISGFREHWLRGGFPDAFLQNNDKIRSLWFRSFISTYIERDLRILGLNTNSGELQRLLYMLAASNGNILNNASLGNSMGLSAVTVRNIISYFEKSFIVRILKPWFSNIGKRLIKSPKVYIRDSGLLNHLLGISGYENMLRHPMLGNLWEAYVIENLINTFGEKYAYYFYRTADGTECDLVIFEGLNCVAAIDAKFSPNPTRTKSMTLTIQDLNPGIALFIIPDCPVIYSIGQGLFVAGLPQAIEKLTS